MVTSDVPEVGQNVFTEDLVPEQNSNVYIENGYLEPRCTSSPADKISGRF